MRYGACVVFEDGTTFTAFQRKALEYGCTSDAVVQLMPFLLGTHASVLDKYSSPTEGVGVKPVLLMQVDQCGLLHAPAAPARAVLAEHGSGSLFVAVHRCWKWVFAALLLHAPRFWIWSFWPLLFMLLESVFRRWRGAFEVQVLEARLFEGDVMQLRMKLGGTRKFVFRAGQYLFLSCPAVSAEEWHPFTITSAPEESTFTCHIRCRKGMDWTYALRMLLNPAGAPRVLFSDQVARGAAEEGGGGSGAGGAGGAAGGAAGAAAAAAAAPLIVKENPLRRHMSLDDNSPEPGGGGGGGGGGGAAAGAARETAAATRRLSMESVSAAALMPSYPVVRPLAARDD